MYLRQSLSAPSLCVGCGLGVGGGHLSLCQCALYIWGTIFREKNSWTVFCLKFLYEMLVNVTLGNYVILLGFGLAMLPCAALTGLFRLNIKQKCSATCPTSYLPSCVQAVFPTVSRPQTVLQTWNVWFKRSFETGFVERVRLAHRQLISIFQIKIQLF